MTETALAIPEDPQHIKDELEKLFGPIDEFKDPAYLLRAYSFSDPFFTLEDTSRVAPGARFIDYALLDQQKKYIARRARFHQGTSGEAPIRCSEIDFLAGDFNGRYTLDSDDSPNESFRLLNVFLYFETTNFSGVRTIAKINYHEKGPVIDLQLPVGDMEKASLLFNQGFPLGRENSIHLIGPLSGNRFYLHYPNLIMGDDDTPQLYRKRQELRKALNEGELFQPYSWSDLEYIFNRNNRMFTFTGKQDSMYDLIFPEAFDFNNLHTDMTGDKSRWTRVAQNYPVRLFVQNNPKLNPPS